MNEKLAHLLDNVFSFHITADLLGTGHPLARPPQDAAAVVWT